MYKNNNERASNRPFTYERVIVFDYDNTLVESVGTFEKDYDLEKFIKDNSFWNNLFTKKLPLAYSINNFFYDGLTLVVIHTARAKRWWFPIVLFLKGIKYHELIQRPPANSQDSAYLKKWQLVKFLQEKKIGTEVFKIFVDDFKPNRDQIETIGFSVYNADYYNLKE